MRDILKTKTNYRADDGCAANTERGEHYHSHKITV